jgi:hypothetical protein
MDGVMSLQEVSVSNRSVEERPIDREWYAPPRKGHMTGVAFERFDISVCQRR